MINRRQAEVRIGLIVGTVPLLKMALDKSGLFL